MAIMSTGYELPISRNGRFLNRPCGISWAPAPDGAPGCLPGPRPTSFVGRVSRAVAGIPGAGGAALLPVHGSAVLTTNGKEHPFSQALIDMIEGKILPAH